jgi:hypothetical protein
VNFRLTLLNQCIFFSKLQHQVFEHSNEYDYYLVELLYEEKLLKWKPSLNKWLDSAQKFELDFLYTLRFKNCLPENQVKQMLSQLQKPYIYSFECISSYSTSLVFLDVGDWAGIPQP